MHITVCAAEAHLKRNKVSTAGEWGSGWPQLRLCDQDPELRAGGLYYGTAAVLTSFFVYLLS